MALDKPDSAPIAALCEETLRKNWRQGVRSPDGTRFAYTCPSPGHYPWQWYWDSCFTAIVWRRFDSSRSRQELQSLLSAQRDDGFIGHTIFWDTPLRGQRRFTYNVTSPNATMTASIQPPILAWAWKIAVGDPADVPGIVRHYDWLDEHRDLDGDGLIWIVQPDESGLDASPQFDAIWGHQAHGRLPGFVTLVRRNRRLGYDLRRTVGAGGPVCAEVAMNVLNNLSRLALGRSSLTPTIIERMYDGKAGLFWPLARPERTRPAEVAMNVLNNLSRLALGRSSLTPTIVERMYDAKAGLFWPLARPEPTRRIALTWAALSPLALPDLPEEIGRRLVEEHLLDEDRFWLAVPPPSVAASDPAFSLDDRGLFGLRRYWRGPTWVNAAWLLWLGLVRLGYEDHAAELSRRVSAAVATARLCEYYNPRDGRGMGAHDFAWSTLVMELVEPDRRAGESYLDAPSGAVHDADA